jgi:glycyl-tRNA synthetase beta chain
MGGYYARHDGETEAVALAIEDHYKPRFAGDTLPRNAVGLVLALADRLETLAGLFGIGQVPSGDRDPFAMRRHALGAAHEPYARPDADWADQAIALPRWPQTFADGSGSGGTDSLRDALLARGPFRTLLREQGVGVRGVRRLGRVVCGWEPARPRLRTFAAC